MSGFMNYNQFIITLISPYIRMSAITHQQLVENYEVIRVLGEGSFGKVFLIRHRGSRVEYAMKKYSKYHILKNGKEKSLIRSSRILQALEHKGIIRFIYYAIGDEDDEIFLIFEACKKGSLEEIKMKVFAMRQMTLIKQIMHQLAQSLLYLKSVSVAHRDLKPSNISFSSQGELKLIDFDEAVCFNETQQISNKDLGFAKQLSQQTSTMKLYSRRSRANSFVGTEMYMSPQMRHNTITDQRGDIWAYGCILYELVIGKSLMAECQEQEQIEVTMNNLKSDLESLKMDELQKNHVQDLLERVLQINPDNRLSIDKITKHEFFREYKDNGIGRTYQDRLKKFLRGNYNISDPRNVLDALNMDLIGMKAGSEKFLELSQHPILIYREKHELSPLGLMQRIKRNIKNFIYLPFYKINYIMGGSRYFKTRSSINEGNKEYIFYDQIDCIKIVEDSIVIESNNGEKWNATSDKAKKYKCYFIIKSISNDQYQLGLLYETLQYIFND